MDDFCPISPCSCINNGKREAAILKMTIYTHKTKKK